MTEHRPGTRCIVHVPEGAVDTHVSPLYWVRYNGQVVVVNRVSSVLFDYYWIVDHDGHAIHGDWLQPRPKGLAQLVSRYR
jgi:hypothetical protein